VISFLYKRLFFLIIGILPIFSSISLAQEGMPVKFDTVYLYAYYSLCEENCPQTTPPWNPLWYYYKIEQNEGTEENTLVCKGPEVNYFSPFYLNIHYLIYPQPGFINNFTDPGGDFEEFLGGVFPIIFERPTLNFYDTFNSKKPKWTVPDSLLYGDGLGVPLMTMDQTDPVEGDLLLYSRIFPFPPPWEEYKANPMYSAPPFLSLWEEIEDANEGKTVVIDGYMGVTLKAKEMFGKTKDVKLPRLNYHYEECDPGCKELAAYAKTHGARGVMPNPLNPEDNVSYQIDSEAINICSRGIPGGATGITLPPGTVVNPKSGFGPSNIYNINDINIKTPQNVDAKKVHSNLEKTIFANPPLGPYPDYIEVYRDDTGMHDAMATINLSWVFNQSSIFDQIENIVISTFDEDCIYGGNCSLPQLGIFGGSVNALSGLLTNLGNLGRGGSLSGIFDNVTSNVLNLLAEPLRRQLPPEEVYDKLKDGIITFQYVKLDYHRNPYSDKRCPEFTVYTASPNGVLLGPHDIFDLISWQIGGNPPSLPSLRSTIAEKNADFPVLGTVYLDPYNQAGIWQPCSNNDNSCFEPVSDLFVNLHNMECEYSVYPTYYIGGSYGTEVKGGEPFTVNIKLYN
jgi:hypothetical protein